MDKIEIFKSEIYFDVKNEWVDNLNICCDKYIKKARNNNKLYKKENIYVSEAHDLGKDLNFTLFKDFILKKSFFILKEQGYLIDDYLLSINEFWVQEFYEKGGGNHIPHTHSNSHISGFYFLKCSENTSYPIFHDSRLSKKMIQLLEKDKDKTTNASEEIHLKFKTGVFVFFNSYLEHEFVIDKGLEPFRFIHFNIQAISKNIINNYYNK